MTIGLSNWPTIFALIIGGVIAAPMAALTTRLIPTRPLMGLVGAGMYPNLVRGTDPSTSLSVYNAASSEGTLRTMLLIAAIGIPLVLGYTVSIYWIFRGKVKLDSMSY